MENPIVAPAFLNGHRTNRVMLILMTKGCEYALKTGGCTNCGFLEHSTKGKFVSSKNIACQFDSLFKKISFKKFGIKEIDLFAGGSFLADNEVPPDARKHILDEIAKNCYLRSLMIESRPEYVTKGKIKTIKQILGNKLLWVGIGIESSNDYIREVIVRKGFGKKEFENAAGILKGAGACLQAYVLVKPLSISEADAIKDSTETIKYIFKLAKKLNLKTRIALEPVFVAKGSKLEKVYEKGEYSLVKLWSVIEVIKNTHNLGEIQVGLSDEGLAYSRVPNNCKRCSKQVRNALHKFNATQNIEALKNLNCKCKEEWVKSIVALV